MPQVKECINSLLEGVFRLVKTGKIPARRRGQHQLPTNAGMEKINVQIIIKDMILSIRQ